MPERTTVRRARLARRQGKAKTTQAGKFVRGEMRRIKRRRPTAKRRAQAVAIGLSKARRSGVKVAAKRRVTGSRTKAPQRSRARTRRATTGSRRAPTTTRRASARTGRARSTARRTTRRIASRSRAKR